MDSILVESAWFLLKVCYRVNYKFGSKISMRLLSKHFKFIKCHYTLWFENLIPVILIKELISTRELYLNHLIINFLNGDQLIQDGPQSASLVSSL